MRVLHVIPSLSVSEGGPSAALRLIARSLVRAGVELEVATTDDDGWGRRALGTPETPVEQDGYSVRFFHKQTEFYKVSLPLGRWLSQSARQYNLIHIHALFSFSSTSAAWTARRFGVPYVIRPLGVLNRWGLENRHPRLKRLSIRLIELRILCGATAVHYTSEAERLQAGAIHPKIAELPSFIIPLPIEAPTNDATSSDFSRRFPRAAGKRIILFLSRIDPKKGIDLLLKSFVSVSQSDPNLLLVIAGDGNASYIESLQTLARKLEISDGVLWTGHLGPSDKAAAMAAATLFVLPSYSENFGIAAAEALASGVPTILTDGVALAADAREAGAAVVVRPEVEDLRSAIARVLGDKALRDRIEWERQRNWRGSFTLQKPLPHRLSSNISKFSRDLSVADDIPYCVGPHLQ